MTDKVIHKTTHDLRIYAEQVALLYKPFMLSAAATFVAAVLLVVGQWDVIEHDVLLGWLLAILLLTLLRILLTYLYHRRKNDANESKLWGRLFIAGSAVAGITWAAGSILLYPENNIEHQIFLVFVLTGICSGAVTTLSVMRIALYVFMVPALIPVALLFIMEATPLSTIVALMVFLALGFYMKGANNIYYNNQENIRLRLAAIEKEQSLLLAKKQTEKECKAKSEMLSRMSHELRTPMNAILGFGQLLEMDAEEFNETQRDNIKEILDAGHHLLSLINEVLDLTRIESGKLDIDMQEVHIIDVLQQSIDQIGSMAEARHLTLIDKFSNHDYIVLADANCLKQVMLNLLTNAVKYNRDHGSITLHTEIVKKQRLRISVIDTGKGLTEADISRLFIPFEYSKTVSNIEGTGIGLVIVKRLVELMGGDVGVKSTLAEGSVFWVELKALNELQVVRSQ